MYVITRGFVVVSLMLGWLSNIATAAPLEGFEKAIAIKTPVADYPFSQLHDNSSGVAELIYMVDKQGKPFEIMVSNASLSAFSNMAVYAVRKFRFEPATLNGKPVESVQRLRYNFRISRQDHGASLFL